MTFAHVGSLGTKPGRRDDVVSILLRLASVRGDIDEAMPLLSGEMGGQQFSVIGSPLK